MKDYKKLYDENDLKMMHAAEKGRLPGKNRIEELISYAQKAGIKRIGIAHCISFQKETNMLIDRLQKHFEVHSVDCKIGKIPSAELLNDDSAKGLSCNPAGQAEALAENQTELNISLGLCIGHDIVFNQKSQVPTTTLIAKDREHQHQTYKEFSLN